MKVSSVFNVITDASDLLDLFAKVDNREQMISRLERLKREAPEELLYCIEGLRVAIASLLNDTLEMSAVVDGPNEEDSILDDELAGIDADEKPNLEGTAPPEDPKNVVPSTT